MIFYRLKDSKQIGRGVVARPMLPLETNVVDDDCRIHIRCLTIQRYGRLVGTGRRRGCFHQCCQLLGQFKKKTKTKTKQNKKKDGNNLSVCFVTGTAKTSMQGIENDLCYSVSSIIFLYISIGLDYI